MSIASLPLLPAAATVGSAPAAALNPAVDLAGVRRFLDTEARAALDRLLSQLAGEAGTAVMTRAKLKPGRKLSVTFAVRAGDQARPWPVVLVWTAAGSALPPDESIEVEAHRRGVTGPFRRLWARDERTGATAAVAPLDTAFPQLVRLYDAAHVRGMVPGLGPIEAIHPVRYRPGERHVLALRSEAATAYAKVYRDGTGEAAMAAARAADGVLRASADATVAVRGVAYERLDRVALWEGVEGAPLREHVQLRRPGVHELVQRAGIALRALHDRPALLVGSRATCGPELAAAARAAEGIVALVPGAAERVAAVLDRAAGVCSGHSQEPARTCHRDYKCDNLVIDDAGGIHVLDFDRSAPADAAVDIGKFVADLGWWCADEQDEFDAVSAAFLAGYGAAPGGRLDRARGYAALFHVKVAARRAALWESSFERSVDQCLRRAEQALEPGNPW